MVSAADFLRRRERTEAPVPAAPPESYAVSLPSRGLLYPSRLDTVQMSPFTIGQVRALKAVRPGVTPAAEADRILVAVMAKSIHGADPLDLSEGDFRFLMYWARINSFGPYSITLQSKWPDTGEPISKVIDKTDLVPIAIDPARPIDRRFGPLTMRDKIAIQDLDDPAEQWVATHAAYLRDGTLKERIERLETMSLTELAAIQAHMTATDHGVCEYAVVTRIKEGQTEAVRVELKLDITDFFP